MSSWKTEPFDPFWLSSMIFPFLYVEESGWLDQLDPIFAASWARPAGVIPWPGAMPAPSLLAHLDASKDKMDTMGVPIKGIIAMWLSNIGYYITISIMWYNNL